MLAGLPQPHAPATTLGPYAIVRELGRGATAVVYEATHQALGKRVALKALHAHLARDPKAAARFVREGRAASKIASPNIVNVFDVGTAGDGVPYLVMELLRGEDLAAMLRRRGRLSAAEVASIVLPVAAAVHAAHVAGVVHRDLKPSNVFVADGDDGLARPIVLDFGISKVNDDADPDLTASEVLLGTIHYMSPEQTRGGRNATPRSDQYALGVLLYECATGRKPFAGNTPYALMHAIVAARTTPPSALAPELPASFDAVVSRAMHRDPDRRFPSMRELGAALLPFAERQVQERWSRELGGTTTKRQAGRGRLVAAVAAACALAAVVATGVWQRSRVEPAPPSRADTVPGAAPPADNALATDPVAPPLNGAPAALAAPAPRSLGHDGASSAGARRPSPSPAPSTAARPVERGVNGAPIVE